MNIALVGGGLQGVETAYLARKAGWHVTLVDRRFSPPARGLSQAFKQIDIGDGAEIKHIFEQVDLVLPALENRVALDALVAAAKGAKTPLAFDPAAYAVTCSKAASNRLFAQLNLLLPSEDGQHRGAVIVKPNSGSGSSGVRLFSSRQAAKRFLAHRPQTKPLLCQQFLDGPTFSIEVLGRPGQYRTFAVTDLFMDEAFDCKRVRAPSSLPPVHQATLAAMSHLLAEALALTGLMDVEVVLWEDRLYVLEIDARIPSQTPTAVYWTSGVNLIELLGNLFVRHNIPVARPETPKRAVVYEHIGVQQGLVHVCGESRLGRAGSLRLVADFFGCDEAITDFEKGCDAWAATLICCGKDPAAAWRKRCAAIERIGDACNPGVVAQPAGGSV